MEKLKLKRINSTLWVGLYEDKRFELIVKDHGYRFMLKNGELTRDEFEDVCLRFYYNEFEYVDSIV